MFTVVKELSALAHDLGIYFFYLKKIFFGMCRGKNMNIVIR